MGFPSIPNYGQQGGSTGSTDGAGGSTGTEDTSGTEGSSGTEGTTGAGAGGSVSNFALLQGLETLRAAKEAHLNELQQQLKDTNTTMLAGQIVLDNLTAEKIQDNDPANIQALVDFYNEYVADEDEQVVYDASISNGPEDITRLTNIRAQVKAHVQGLSFISKQFELDVQKAAHDYALVWNMCTEILSMYGNALNSVSHNIGS